MATLRSGIRDVPINYAAMSAEELIAALGNPLNDHDNELLRSLGIAPIESVDAYEAPK